MPTKRTYHGWIYIEKESGFKDHYSVHVTRPGKAPLTFAAGYGAPGVAAAVAFFEEAGVSGAGGGGVARLNLGPVKLERTPVGLRVFTEEEEEVPPSPKVSGVRQYTVWFNGNVRVEAASEEAAKETFANELAYADGPTLRKYFRVEDVQPVE